jgi:two-component system, chemotaxis family, sensor kinase CheA
MSDNSELIKEFLLESYENLDRLDRDFVTLEKNPDDTPTLSSIFRTIHTIKGTCGFLGFHKLESVTHVGENLLSKLRDGKLTLTAERTSAMLAMVDAVRALLGSIERTDAEGDADYGELVARLERLVTGEEGVMPTGRASSGTEVLAADGATVFNSEIDAALGAPPPPVPTVDVAALAAEAPAQSVAVEFPRPQSVVVDGKAVNQKVIGDASAPPAPLQTPQSPQSPVEGESGKPSVADSAIRVDVVLLDRLMNLVGELVLARNQILQYSAVAEHAALGAATQRLNLITTELQEGVMKTRMQPINIIWQKFPRVVRDLAGQFGKQIRLEMDGKETELDKSIVEAIKDPLTHIVRNSVDHGIESPEARRSRGKPAEGTLTLRAFHEGGQVNIEIADDGGGINAEKVKAKAVEKGLITADQAAAMGEREAVNLIFLPGFSTAEKITNVSGRGVGMDVVKTNIEKIGGAVDIQTRPGEGTTLRIKIPLTLAIIPALLVTSGGERFAIPQVSLLELVRLDGDEARGQIEQVHGAEVYRLRGQLLPLVSLNRQLKLPEQSADSVVNIVVLQADGRQFGLIVDQINDTEEIVVKPLGKQLKGLGSFAGATIMGDGKVALILDVMGLAQSAGVVGESREAHRGVAEGVSARGTVDQKQAVLLFSAGGNSRMAVELGKVARLEEFSPEAIESEGGAQVVQYRGSIMPLVSLAERFGRTSSAEAGAKVPVVVCAAGSGHVGLSVDAILDIVEENLVIDPRRRRDGVIGSAVVQGKVTELLDVACIVRESTGTDTNFPPSLAA